VRLHMGLYLCIHTRIRNTLLFFPPPPLTTLSPPDSTWPHQIHKSDSSDNTRWVPGMKMDGEGLPSLSLPGDDAQDCRWSTHLARTDLGYHTFKCFAVCCSILQCLDLGYHICNYLVFLILDTINLSPLASKSVCHYVKA